jgi:hypothetical protein
MYYRHTDQKTKRLSSDDADGQESEDLTPILSPSPPTDDSNVFTPRSILYHLGLHQPSTYCCISASEVSLTVNPEDPYTVDVPASVTSPSNRVEIDLAYRSLQPRLREVRK